MRAVRVECAFSAIEDDSRAQAGLQCISWDFRSMLGMVDGNLRIMVECITIDGNCPREGYYVDGIRLCKSSKSGNLTFLTHHLVVLKFSSDFFGHYFHGGI
ncbi:MAG: hypothetical protein Ct9H90mP14_0930 [Methanobacteriota archaeon]|nr:MAG: hypothetical protein Ct9H90mP14_0930 [Euryarchaeota archaeon]